MNFINLFELNQQIGQTLRAAFAAPLWVCAEISEVRENVNGHCYLELIERDESYNQIIAKAKATIWSFTYKMLKPYFEQQTGQVLSAGMKILVSVTVEYHEAYGLSLNIKDIDPTYSVGDIARRRLQIVNRLREDGVFDMNRELEMPLVPQRIAVISSPTAAGYGDFINQLENNHIHFYCKLFPATMQGVKTEESVIASLDKIYNHVDLFDVVVIIRGGGATADLSAFDSYDLAHHCAQFPLPIIAGIGHLRDETILDLIAHTSVKTPTAAAEILIAAAGEVADFLDEAQAEIFQSAKEILLQKKNDVNMLAYRTRNVVPQIFLRKRQELSIFEKILSLNSPENILKKGYSITTKNSKVIFDNRDLQKGDRIETHFAKGCVEAEVI